MPSSVFLLSRLTRILLHEIAARLKANCHIRRLQTRLAPGKENCLRPWRVPPISVSLSLGLVPDIDARLLGTSFSPAFSICLLEYGNCFSVVRTLNSWK